jgi:hypothetical protein
MKAFGGVDVENHVVLTSPLVGDELSASRHGSFYPRVKSPRDPLYGKLGVSQSWLDDMEKRKSLALPVLELRPFCGPASGKSLYRLCYPGSYLRGMQVE